jgi:hypothetical protein
LRGSLAIFFFIHFIHYSIEVLIKIISE